MINRLTAFFLALGWKIPWKRISLLPDGWPMRLGFLCPDSEATTIYLGKYYIGYKSAVPEKTLAHELTHVWQMEQAGVYNYVKDYARQYCSVGYSKISWEVEAERIEAEYASAKSGQLTRRWIHNEWPRQ